jgi:hypothetical protein
MIAPQKVNCYTGYIIWVYVAVCCLLLLHCMSSTAKSSSHMACQRRLAVILGSGKDALSALFCLVFLWRCCTSAYMLNTLLRAYHRL